MVDFSFQLEHKSTGCEDAPPVSSTAYTIVCDGLGGAGSSKHIVGEDASGNAIYRTSAYLGSRAVCDAVTNFYGKRADGLFLAMHSYDRVPYVEKFLADLHSQIVAALDVKMSELHIEKPKGRTLKVLPTTLASALYFPHDGKLTVLAVWAGDSRVYVLTPSKGLQLLSLDDAEGAGEEMNSVSEMTNLISAGRQFKLNYALYELTEPGIVFCCSDGCSDLPPSPLHFEYYLTMVVAECMQENTSIPIGELFANAIRDTVYAGKICDDTTMAGVIFGIDSVTDLKEKFVKRKSVADSKALQMNSCMKELRKLREANANKALRMAEGKVLPEIKSEIFRSIHKEASDTPLDKYIRNLPCYLELLEHIKEIEANADRKSDEEAGELRLRLEKIKDECRQMLVCDFVGSKQGGATKGLMGNFMSTFGDKPNNDVSSAVQTLQACRQMVNHSEFKKIVSLPVPDVDYTGYIESITNQIEALLKFFEEYSQNQLFNDMWQQAFYSTSKFESKRSECERDQTLKSAFNDFKGCWFASELTKQKLHEYQGLQNSISEIQTRNSKQEQDAIELAKREFLRNHEKEIVEQILNESSNVVLMLFEGSSVPTDELHTYVEAKTSVKGSALAIQEAQKAINALWEEYKVDYQLNKKIKEKGVVY